MENREGNPGISKSSNIIIITPEELLKLDLFKEIQSSVVAPKQQVTESSTASLKQKIRNKLKAGTHDVNTIVKEKPKSKTQVKLKSYGELLNQQCHISKPELSCKKNTSCMMAVKKDELHAKNPPMAVSISTNEDCSKLNSGYKISESNVRHSAITKTMPKDKLISTEKIIETGKSVILLSNPNINISESKNEQQEGASSFEMNFAKSTTVNIINKSTNIQSTIISAKSRSRNMQQERITDSEKNTDIENNGIEECQSSKRDIINPEINKKTIKESCLNKFEDTSMQNSITKDKKDVNFISDTPVCFSSEELKHIVSKAICNTQSTFLKAIPASEGSGRPQQIIKLDENCGSEKDCIKDSHPLKETASPKHINKEKITPMENVNLMTEPLDRKENNQQINRHVNTKVENLKINVKRGLGIKDNEKELQDVELKKPESEIRVEQTKAVTLTDKEQKYEDKASFPENDVQIARDNTENIYKLVENNVLNKRKNNKEENQPKAKQQIYNNTESVSVGTHDKYYINKQSNQNISKNDTKREQKKQFGKEILHNRESEVGTDENDKNTSRAANTKKTDNNDRTAISRKHGECMKTSGTKNLAQNVGPGIKTDSRKSNNIASKEKTVDEIDTRICKNEQQSLTEINLECSIQETERKVESNNPVKPLEKPNPSVALPVRKKRGRKRRLIVLDNVSIIKEDDLSDNKNKFTECEEPNVENKKLVHLPCASNLQTTFTLEDKSDIIYTNENLKKNVTSLNKPDMHENKEYDTAVCPKQEAHVLETIASKVLIKGEVTESENIKEERNIEPVLIPSHISRKKNVDKGTLKEESSEGQSNLIEDELNEKSIVDNSGGNFSRIKPVEGDLNITSLHKSLETSVLTSQGNNITDVNISIGKTPRKRGRPRKNINAVESPQEIESVLSSLRNETLNKTSKIESIEGKDENLTECSFSSSFNTVDNSGGNFSATKPVEGDLNVTSLHKSLETSILTSQGNNVTDVNISIGKTPRKRGRPRKNINAVESPQAIESVSPSPRNETLNKTSKTESIESNDEILSEGSFFSSVNKTECGGSGSSSLNNVVDETPKEMPRKRGRPRKNAKPPTEEEFPMSTPTQRTAPTHLTENILLDVSLSGRKRRKINYYEIENGAEIENDDGKMRKHKISTTYKASSKFKKLSTEVRENENKFNSGVSTINTPSSQNSDGIFQEEDIQKDCALIQEKKDNIDEDLERECDTSKGQDSQFSDCARNIKKSKYRNSGDTIMMMNSIFSAAFKNKSNNGEAEKNNLEGNLPNLQPPARIDRRRKSAKTVAIVIDKDNMVMCMTCNKKVDNIKWAEHNRNNHYNLSWREGESEVNMDDSELIIKTLKPILQKDKVLICSKCDKKWARVEHYITHWEKCVGIVSSSGLITCAVCKSEMEKSKWSFHKQKQHNNLAWRVGDHPLNLNDQNFVLSILNALYKAKKPLHCEKCGALKKSVVGFLSHQSQCGFSTEDVKVKCELCGKKVLPVSMPSHMKMIHESSRDMEELAEMSNYADSNNDTDCTLSKRKAARTAMMIIDNYSKHKIVEQRHKHYVAQVDFRDEYFISQILQKEFANNQMIKCKFKNCKFETDIIKVLLDHMNSCENKPNQYYICKKCLLICDNEDEIKKHIKAIHAIDIIEDDFKAEYEEDSNEEFDDAEKMELYRKGLKKRKNLEKKAAEADINYKIKPSFLLRTLKKNMMLFSHAFEYTIQFCLQNFSQTPLFDKLRNSKNDWMLLNDDITEQYLPRSEESCAVARRVVRGFQNVLGSEYTFKKFELFESDCDQGNVTIFCGGPIYAMAWLPTPYKALNSKQILAVASGKCFDEKYLINENYNDPSLIQFWDFDVLQNKGKMSQPKLMFCLALDFGPVWYMEWCPSGCYDSDFNQDEDKPSRLGLLAVAGSNSFVYIYSIPVLEETQMELIYKVKPVLRLQLDDKRDELTKKQKFFATKISWSMVLGHQYIAVGYTDGMVGLFDMDINSKLLKYKDDDVDVLLPYKIFQAHMYYITALNWVPLGGGNRWLMTASFDRNICVWDLSNDTKFSTLRRNIISDGVWLANWIAYVTSDDESSTSLCSMHACVQSYRCYMYDHAYLTLSPASITSLSSSSWLNSFIQCSAQGEVVVVLPNQMLFCLNSEKKAKFMRYCLSYTKLIDKHKTPEERVADERIVKEVHKKYFGKTSTKKRPISSLFDIDPSDPSNYEPQTYKEANGKYALLFCDMNMDKFSNLPNPNIEDLSSAKPNLYSMQKINKIAYNPNRQASLYYATGYQAGFLRIAYMKFLENDPQVAQGD